MPRSPGWPCKTEHYIRDYIRLVEQGEERLIQGVDQGVFPIKFAVHVAMSESSQIQNVLMDAFDEGIVTTNNFRPGPADHHGPGATRITARKSPPNSTPSGS